MNEATRKELIGELSMDVMPALDGEATVERAAMADLLEEDGRDEEAALVRSGVAVTWPVGDEGRYDTSRIIPGVHRMRREKEEAAALAKAAENDSTTFDLFAEGNP